MDNCTVILPSINNISERIENPLDLYPSDNRFICVDRELMNRQIAGIWLFENEKWLDEPVESVL